jgi:hypothetical protein
MNTKKLLLAIKETIFMIASLHIALLVLYAVWHQEWVLLDLANILDAHLFIEGFEYSITTAGIGLVVLLLLLLRNYRATKE